MPVFSTGLIKEFPFFLKGIELDWEIDSLSFPGFPLNHLKGHKAIQGWLAGEKTNGLIQPCCHIVTSSPSWHTIRPNVKTLPRMVNNHHGAPYLSGLGDHHIEILHLTGWVFISDINQVTQVIQNHYGVTVVRWVSLDPIQEIQLMPIKIQAEEVFYGIGLWYPGDKEEVFPQFLKVYTKGRNKKLNSFLNVFFKHLSIHITNRLWVIICPIKNFKSSFTSSNQSYRKW